MNVSDNAQMIFAYILQGGGTMNDTNTPFPVTREKMLSDTEQMLSDFTVDYERLAGNV